MTLYLLDTNVISELIKKSPSKSVTSWMLLQPEETLHLSVITVAEIMRGVSKLPESEKKNRLANWIKSELPTRFGSRTVPFNMECAYLWGELQGEADKRGKPYPVMDLQLAATAIHYDLVLVTRNVKDFSALRAKIFNPYT